MCGAADHSRLSDPDSRADPDAGGRRRSQRQPALRLPQHGCALSFRAGDASARFGAAFAGCASQCLQPGVDGRRARTGGRRRSAGLPSCSYGRSARPRCHAGGGPTSSAGRSGPRATGGAAMAWPLRATRISAPIWRWPWRSRSTGRPARSLSIASAPPSMPASRPIRTASATRRKGGIIQSLSWAIHEEVTYDPDQAHQLRLGQLSHPALRPGARCHRRDRHGPVRPAVPGRRGKRRRARHRPLWPMPLPTRPASGCATCR